MLVGTREPLAAVQLPWSLDALRTPRQQVPEQPQGLLSFQKGQKAGASKQWLFWAMEPWGWPRSTGSRRMGALGCQLSDPLGPPARLVPRRLASGHGAPVGGAVAAPPEPAYFGESVGLPWVCMYVCMCIVEGRGSFSPCDILGSSSLVHPKWKPSAQGKPESLAGSSGGALRKVGTGLYSQAPAWFSLPRTRL